MSSDPPGSGDGSGNRGRTKTLPLGAPSGPRHSERGLVSSASTPTQPPQRRTSGVVTLTGAGLPEALARELITRRFAQSGYQLEADYQFRHGDTLVVLDGFDPRYRTGYQYISHNDEDVVTDHDVGTSAALEELAASGEARVLVIHDGEVESGDDLVAMVDEFLSR